MKLQYNILVIIIAILIISCNSEKENCIQKITANCENKILSEQTIIKGKAYSGDSFSRIGYLNSFGLGHSLSLPDSLMNRELKIVISGWFRSNVLQSKGAVVISVANNDQMLSWNTYLISNSILEPNTWAFFKDSIILLKKYNNSSYNKISVFSFIEQNTQEEFDTDDLTISYYTID